MDQQYRNTSVQLSSRCCGSPTWHCRVCRRTGSSSGRVERGAVLFCTRQKTLSIQGFCLFRRFNFSFLALRICDSSLYSRMTERERARGGEIRRLLFANHHHGAQSLGKSINTRGRPSSSIYLFCFSPSQINSDGAVNLSSTSMRRVQEKVNSFCFFSLFLHCQPSSFSSRYQHTIHLSHVCHRFSYRVYSSSFPSVQQPNSSESLVFF